MKRILVYGLSGQYAGTENYFLTMCRSLKNDNIVFDFLYHHSVEEITYQDILDEMGSKIYRDYYFSKETGSDSIKTLFDNHPEWDGVYLNVQAPDTAYRLVLEAKKRNLEYRIVHSHNSFYTKEPTLKNKVYALYYHLTNHNKITHRLACSDYAGKWMFRNQSFKTVPNSIDFSKYQINTTIRKCLRNEYKVADDDIVIGFCGRLSNQKNIPFLIEIFKEANSKNRHTKLLIIGDGIELEAAKKKIERLNLINDVIFTGAIRNVSDYLQMMDCFLLPSKYEGLGIVLLEAQAAGLKCFTSKDVVPKYVDFTGRVDFIPLTLGADYWATRILETDLDRKDVSVEFSKSDFTIMKTVGIINKIFE